MLIPHLNVYVLKTIVLLCLSDVQIIPQLDRFVWLYPHPGIPSFFFIGVYYPYTQGIICIFIVFQKLAQDFTVK